MPLAGYGAQLFFKRLYFRKRWLYMIYPKADLSKVHPPKDVCLSRAGRYLSIENEISLVSILHAVVHANEDEKYDWPTVSRGRFSMALKEDDDEKKVVASFKFAGDDPSEENFHHEGLRLSTDDGDTFYIKIDVIPPECDDPTDENWHALCLAKDLEHDLAYATLCFFENKCPNNGNLLRIVSIEKNRIMHQVDSSYASREEWKDHLAELECSVRDAINNTFYIKSDWESGVIPQHTRNYRAWFNKLDMKKCC